MRKTILLVGVISSIGFFVLPPVYADSFDVTLSGNGTTVSDYILGDSGGWNKVILNDGNERLQIMGAHSSGEGDTDASLNKLLDPDPDVRLEGCTDLWGATDSKALDGLAGVLNDEDPEVSFHAAQTLGYAQDARAIPVLVSFLSSGSLRYRDGVASVLINMGPLIEEPVLKLAQDKTADIEARQMAVYVLGDNGNLVSPRDTAEALIDLLAEPEEGSYGIRDVVTNALYFIGEPSIEPLMNALDSDNEYVRGGAVQALGYFTDYYNREEGSHYTWNDPGNVEIYSGFLLEDPSPFVRFYASRSLGMMSDPRAVDPLVSALDDPDGEVRFNAASGLMELYSETDAETKDKINASLPKITEVLADRNPWMLGQYSNLFMSTNKPLVSESGELNPNLQFGETGYYKDFPVEYEKPEEDRWGTETFTFRFSINGYRDEEGNPFVFSDNALEEITFFIDEKTNLDQVIIPCSRPDYTTPTVYYPGEALSSNEFLGFSYDIRSNNDFVEGMIYCKMGSSEGIIRTDRYQNDGSKVRRKENEVKAMDEVISIILDAALITPPSINDKVITQESIQESALIWTIP
ncbi:MAG: HEAT repeat domain-containing protein [Candidatus Colwellbacteria bacterium]|nr:HEAT repeat domain-containing protein [Candidatus Colwellbacteria bacterium]